MKHVLAIDQGTTGTTCLVISADGRVVGRAYREITQHYPRPGWVEHDPVEILDRTLEAAAEAVRASGAMPVAIGITNQRETAVVWERNRPRDPPRAIVWQDRRTATRCAELASHAPAISGTTGLTVDPYFSAAKIQWLLDHHGWQERAQRGEVLVGTIDTWLIWHLTGGRVHATDPTNASRTSLYDIHRLEWSDEMCRLFGVPREALPEVRPSAGDFGRADAALIGGASGASLPIAGVAGDQQAALFGHGCCAAGEGKNTYGTGAFLLLHTGPRAPEPADTTGLLTTVACGPRGEAAYALEASIFIAGAALQWLRDGLGIIRAASDTEALAQSVPSTDGVVFVPALTGLGAPHWEPAARGTIVGLTRGTTRAHLVRAALEAMAYSTDEVLSAMRTAVDGAPFPRLRVDGGATQNDWLMQFQADVLGVPVERPDLVEVTALGAAGLAGIATGVWADVQAFVGRRAFRRFEPGSGRAAARAGAKDWARAVRAALGWARDQDRGRVSDPGG